MLHLYGFCFSHGLESIKEINETVKVFLNLTVPTANISAEWKILCILRDIFGFQMYLCFDKELLCHFVPHIFYEVEA